MLQPPKYGSIPTPALLNGDPRHYILGLLTAINVVRSSHEILLCLPIIIMN